MRKISPGTALQYAVTILLACIMLLPFVWMVALSLKTLGSFYEYPPRLLTKNPQWSNFMTVLDQFSLFRYFWNSLFVALAIAGLQVIFASMAAFAFAVMRFRGSHLLFMSFLASMMFPVTVILLPLFLVVRELGLIDTYGGLILPFVFTGYGIFMIRQFFLSLPRDYFEAARMDGCSYFGVYARIYLPLSRTALVTLGTIAFMYFYNLLLWPLVTVNSEHLKTIPIGIAGLVGQNSSYPHLIMAGTTITVIPGLIIFVILQRYFVRGIVMSGIKG
jgi:multiple sugar transport system permease protein